MSLHCYKEIWKAGESTKVIIYLDDDVIEFESDTIEEAKKDIDNLFSLISYFKEILNGRIPPKIEVEGCSCFSKHYKIYPLDITVGIDFENKTVDFDYISVDFHKIDDALDMIKNIKELILSEIKLIGSPKDE